MTRFVVRRLLAALFVMFVISVITFLLLEAIPNGNPAYRIAGRTATPAEIHLIEVKFGFNKPIYVQYAKSMANIFTGKAFSYTQGFNVDSELWHGLPRTLSLALGAGIIWLLVAILVGTLSAIRAGKYADRVLTLLSMAGVSFPPFFLGAVLLYYFGYKARIFPLGGYASLNHPGQWALHMILPWVTLSVPLHRLLLAGAALDDPRHDQRGLRPHRLRQGALRPPGADAPHPAQLADPDRLAVGAGHGPAARGRRDPH